MMLLSIRIKTVVLAIATTLAFKLLNHQEIALFNKDVNICWPELFYECARWQVAQ
jgi:hypothetical protein